MLLLSGYTLVTRYIWVTVSVVVSAAVDVYGGEGGETGERVRGLSAVVGVNSPGTDARHRRLVDKRR